MSSQNRPVGEQVTSQPAKRPSRVTVSGHHVSLTPLLPEHADTLFPLVGGADNGWLWDYMGDGPFLDLPAFRAAIAQKATSEDPFFFAIQDNATGDVVGYASLMRIDTANRAVEVGNIMFSPRLQRTPSATEIMYLLARLAFEDLGYRRYEWKCNALNAPSRRAAERLGFSFEGVFRKHMIVKGRNRDTAWFSMLDDEWPAVKAGFEAWLAPENFDQHGQQKRGLVEFREGKV